MLIVFANFYYKIELIIFISEIIQPIYSIENKNNNKI